MTQKEMLIELIDRFDEDACTECKKPNDECGREDGGCITLADFLLSNGVVVLPCRCKNCVHRHWTQEPEHGKTVHYCDILDAQVDDNFFCGIGNMKNRRANEK